tara:strand:+ start:101 stop:661 length:561 start_codon:yes stop_codon:yes gene_type:complete
MHHSKLYILTSIALISLLIPRPSLGDFALPPEAPQSPEMESFERSCRKYGAKLARVTDGDTAVFNISLGFGVELSDQKVRMFGINTPESRTRDLKEKSLGLLAKNKLKEILQSSNDIKLCVKPGKERGKYGRILAVIFTDGINVNSMMIKEGYGVPYFGGKRSVADFDSMLNKVYAKPKGETANNE